MLESGELQTQVVDLICLVFDIANPDSLQYLKDLRVCLFVLHFDI